MTEAAAPGARGSYRWTVMVVLGLARIAMGYQFQAVASVSPLLVEDFGIDYAMVGTLIGLYLLPGIVLALPGGHLGRRFGEKRVVLVGLALMAVGGAMSGASESYAVMVAGRTVTGIGVVLQFVLMTKMLTDWFSGRELILAMAIYLNGWPVGIGLAMVSQVDMAVEYSWQMVFLSTGVLAALAMVIVWIFYRNPVAAAGGAGAGARPAGLSAREFVLISLAGLIWTLSNAGWVSLISFAPGFMETRGIEIGEAAALTSLATWLAIIGVPLGGYLASRWGRPDVFIVLATVAGGLATAAVPYTESYLASFIVIGLILFIPAGIVAALPIEVMRPENRATGLGLFYTWWYAGMAGLPPVAGWTYDLSGAAAAPLYYAALLILLSLAALLAFRLCQARLPVPGAPGRH